MGQQAKLRTVMAKKKSKFGLIRMPEIEIMTKDKDNPYLPSAVFIAQVLVGPSKQLKQIFQIEHNNAKNPNWLEADQLAIYKRGRGFQLGATEKQIQVVIRAGLEPGTAGPRCLIK